MEGFVCCVSGVHPSRKNSCAVLMRYPDLTRKILNGLEHGGERISKSPKKKNHG